MNKKSVTLIVVGITILIGIYLIFLINSSDSSIVQKSSKQVSELIFDLSELPEGYGIAERTPRLKSDIYDNGISLGWIEGYYMRYTKGENLFDGSAITLAISRYPIENISIVFNDGITELESHTAEELPNPNIGEESMSTRYTNKLNLRLYRIEFIKKDIYVSVSMRGSTDYELLKELAKKAEEKI